MSEAVGAAIKATKCIPRPVTYPQHESVEEAKTIILF